MPRPNRKTPLRDLKTYGRSHAVRLPEYDYASDADIHIVLCARGGTPFHDTPLAVLICENVEFYAKRLGYRLYGYCLMPDHLHVLFLARRLRQAVERLVARFQELHDEPMAQEQTRLTTVAGIGI